MHKKLEAELVSLAHKVLQMKNRDEVIALRDKAQEIHEKLAVLAFVDEYMTTTPNLEVSKEELLRKIDTAITSSNTNKLEKKPIIKKTLSQEKPQKEDKSKKGEALFEPKFDSVKIDIQSLKSNQISSKEEFRDAISADKTSTLFDDDDEGKEKKTLNDKLFKGAIQVGLNDRIAFVNHLFNYNQSDFNRVISQLNTLKTEKEAKNFILNEVKPDYDWQGKETYEERFLALIERRFL